VAAAVAGLCMAGPTEGGLEDQVRVCVCIGMHAYVCASLCVCVCVVACFCARVCVCFCVRVCDVVLTVAGTLQTEGEILINV
jgi:hypothetical protein